MPTTIGGNFTSTGANFTLNIVSGFDWIKVRNLTVAGANQTTAVATEFYWQTGFPNGSQYAYLKSNAANAANLIQYTTAGGFSFVDTSFFLPGALNNGSTGVSAVTNAAPPVVTVGSTANMAAGSIVRLYDIAGLSQIGGIDATVGYNTFSGTTFSLDYFPAMGAGTTGNFRVIPFDSQWYPTVRYITAISLGTTTTITTSVTHGYLVGQVVRFEIPAAFGTIELNGSNGVDNLPLYGTITAVNTATTGAGANSFTVNIDSSTFTAFTIPANGSAAFTWAQVIPVGDDTAYDVANNLNISSGATSNNSFRGVVLTGGAGFPGGATGNTMYWEAGTFDAVYNTI